MSDHPLLDGFCPICNGSCLVGFGNPAPAPTAPGLDDAWADAESAMPEGYYIGGVMLSGSGPNRWNAWAYGPTRSKTRYGNDNNPSPAAALHDLARMMRAREEAR